jgi:hypothetical protein
MNTNHAGEIDMKPLISLTALGLLLFTGGCATSTKVQEMIDASHKDYSQTIKANENSINLLKQASMKALEQNEAQAYELDALEKQMEATLAQLKPMQGNAEAAKVMSAANTVKVAELSDALQANREAINENAEKMETIDRLFEEVMIAHYQNIADSANAAIASLRADDVASTNGAPAGLAAPIEIVAPDASAPTNEAIEESELPEEGM